MKIGDLTIDEEFREKMKRFAEEGYFELYSTIIPEKKEKPIKKKNLEKWLSERDLELLKECNKREKKN